MSSTLTNRHQGDAKSPCFVRFLAVASSIVASILIIQVVILVRHAVTDSEGSRKTVVDGNYATTVTSCGFVKGLVENIGYAFLGIQYAIPPLGVRRWRQADVHHELGQCWTGTYLAIERKKRCWQFYRNGSYDGSEDCLYLDVYTPQLHYQNPLDVVVYLGGDSLDGGESLELQPSAALASQTNVIFVSVAIRRSVLGFLSLKTLSQRSRLKSSGNYGISDLLAALVWVRHNIRHFGGNPGSVTMLSHQSGSTIVGALLRANYGSFPLFHKVWMSGGRFLDQVTMEQADEENLKFFKYSECESIKCLFKLSPEELLESVPYDWRQFHNEFGPSFQEEKHYWLVHDYHILKEPDTVNFDKSFSVSHTPLIPVVMGSPLHVDASLEMRSFMDWNNTEKYREYLESSFGRQFAVQVFNQYNRPDSNNWHQFSAALSDYHTICPLLEVSKKYLRQNLMFTYITTHTSKGGIGNLAKPGSDIQAIFNQSYSRSVKDIKFKENMISLFYSFVKTGKTPDLMDGGTGKFKNFMVDDRIGRVQEYSNCDLWSKYPEFKKDSQYFSATESPLEIFEEWDTSNFSVTEINSTGYSSGQF